MVVAYSCQQVDYTHVVYVIIRRIVIIRGSDTAMVVVKDQLLFGFGVGLMVREFSARLFYRNWTLCFDSLSELVGLPCGFNARLCTLECSSVGPMTTARRKYLQLARP